jgi:hypothetical protein
MSELELNLRSLGHELEWPPTPDLVSRVQHRLTPPLHRQRFLSWRPVLVAGLAIVVLTFGFSPGAREAIARLLGVVGIRIETEVETTVPPAFELGLGIPVAATEVQSLVDYSVLTPQSSELGAPNEIYFNDQRLGGQITLVWVPQPNLPEAADSGVGMLISSFRGNLDSSTYAKELNATRNLLLEVQVRGRPGFWIEGEPHVFLFENTSGVIEFESIRLAGNVLLWEENGVTIRIESALPMEDVRRIAESLTPLTYPGAGE